MGIVEWARSPWGQDVPIHIAFFLLWVSAIAGLLFLIVHAIYVRYIAKPEEFEGTISAEVAARVPKSVPRHSLAARLFHWIMAMAMLALLLTAFLPKVGVRFPWVTYHWIAGLVLSASIIFHIFHASFWLDFWSIWPDKADLDDAQRRLKRAMGQAAPLPRRFPKYPLENKMYHGVIVLAGLAAMLTGVFMMFRVRTGILPRNPYLFGDMTWGLMYVLQFRASRHHVSNGADQQSLVFHRVETAERADDDRAGWGEAFGQNAGPVRIGREARRVHAVIDRLDLRLGNADIALQPFTQIARDRDIAVDHQPARPAHEIVFHIAAVELDHIESVLAMNEMRHAREVGGDDHVEGRQIAGMNDLRPELLQDVPHPAIRADILAGLLVQFVNFNIVAADTLAKIGRLGGANNRVPVIGLGQIVDEIDQTVLEAANGQAVDDVTDERLCRRGRCHRCLIANKNFDRYK